MSALLRNGSDSMLNKRYRIPLAAAIVVNLLYWGCVGDWAQHLKDFSHTHKDLVVDLDMSQYEEPEKKQVEKKETPLPTDHGPAGGKSGSVLPDLSGKPAPGLKELNPYLGGNEPAPVNVNGDIKAPVGNPGQHNQPGPGISHTKGHGGFEDEGKGPSYGPPGPDSQPGKGTFNTAEYMKRVRENTVMPDQAIRRGITGTVTFKVVFDSDGNFDSAEIINSSGSSLLDKAGYALVSSQGGIENSTGESISIEVDVVYKFK